MNRLRSYLMTCSMIGADSVRQDIERLCEHAIAAEREACAQIADAHVVQHDGARHYPPGVRQAVQLEGRAIAEAIRNRKETTG